MNLTKLARLTALTAVMTLGFNAADAVMSYPGIITHTNPDGTTLDIRMHGDERFSYTTTADGMLIKRADDGFYRYATVSAGKTSMTDFIATNADDRAADASMMLSGLDQQAMVAELRDHNTIDMSIPMAANGPMRSASNGTAEKSGAFPTIGSPRVIVILVEYPDCKFKYGKSQFNDWLSKEGYNFNNGTGAATGSVLDYYKASSNNQFTPQFDIVGPVTASKERAYYGKKQNPSMSRVAGLVKEACQKAHDNLGVDFSNYDNDNNGEVDIVYMIFAGAGAADSDDDDGIHAHKWTVYMDGTYKYLNLDGKRISTYGCSPELSYGRYFCAIGTFAHEFGHCLGLGDHYDTDYCGNRTPEDWDIMASGSYNNNGNTPPLMSAYERHVLGWTKPQQLTNRGSYILKAATNGNYDDAYIIPTSKTNEYFVLENRQQTGWDKYLPHHGMLIWHIDYNSSVWSANTINCTEHQYVDIEEAGGVNNRNETATPFPGSTVNRSFTDDTNPSMKTWAGTALKAPITNIFETEDGVITFNFKGSTSTPSPLVLNDPVTTYNQATISWQPLEGVGTYVVTVVNRTDSKVIANEVEISGTSYTLTALDAKTTYDYTIGHPYQNAWGEITSSFTTDVTPLNLRRPENVITTEVGDTYFTTEWTDVELAERYSVNLYTGTEGGATTVTEGFDDQKLLDGWSTNSTEFVTASSYCGKSTPALQIGTNEYVASDHYSANITKISITQRRIGNNSASIIIYGRSAQDDSWRELKTQTSPNSIGKVNITLTAADSIHQIMIMQGTEDGTTSVDDITLSLDSSIVLSPVEGKTDMDSGTTTNHRVEGLDYSTTYYYTIRAHNSIHNSLESAPIEVTTEEFSGIDNVVTDTANLTVEGLVVTVSADTDTTVSIYTPAGLRVITPVRLEAGATASFQLPATGIYLVKTAGKISKIVAQ